MTLQHVVLFSFPDELSATDDAEMRAQVAAWPERIGGIREIRLGADMTGARTRGYSRLLYMEFAGTVELHAYQRHPVHQAFSAWIADRSCTTLAFDYFVDASTVILASEDARGDQMAPSPRPGER